MSKILCIEDDTNIRELILYTLRTMDFDASGVENGEQMWEALEQKKDSLPDLILMDIMLPGDDGTQLLKELKKKDIYCSIPVIMLTAKGSEADKVQSLDYGADDYITKPFGMMELVSRIRAVLRRCVRQETMTWQVLKIRDITMDDLRHQVTVHNEVLSLTLKEYQLLHTFMNHPDIVFTRNQLLDDLWGHEYMGESRTLDVHIATLRQKLGDNGKIIETVRGVGYRMRSQA